MRCKFKKTRRGTQCLNSDKLQGYCLSHYKKVNNIKKKYLDYLISGERE